MKDLLPHNRAAYEAIEEALKTSSRTCVIHPTGTGKSYIAMAYIEAHPEERILFITSYISTLSRFAVKLPQDAFSHLDLTIYSGLGKGTIYDPETLIDRYQKNSVIKMNQYDTIILDEFHRVGADTWEGQVKDLIFGRKAIGFSATPIRYLDDNRDMAKEIFDGNIASEITLHDALVQGLLPKPHYIICRYSLWEDFARAEGELRYKWMTDQEKREASYILTHARQFLQNAEGLDTLFSTRMKNPHGRYIVFCKDTAHLKEMEEESQKWFDWAGEVHYYTAISTIGNAQREISKFERDKSDCLRLLFCVDMLNEGIHIPDINGIIMLRPTQSMIVYLQQLGRALAVDSKERVQIFDIVNNAKELEQGKQFWNGVISGFQQKGEIYEDAFDVFSRDAEFDSLIAHLDRFRHLTSWDYHYELCKQFYEENGHLIVPADYMIEGRNVYSWLIRQRFFRQSLSQEKIEKLNAIGMIWDPKNEINLKWLRGYEAAKAFYEEFGNLDVKASIGEYHGIWLYDWLKSNREKKDELSDQQIRLLDELGMDWAKEKRKQYSWDERFQQLAEYKAINGDPANNTELGTWLSNQRVMYNRGELSQEKIERLESIGVKLSGNEARTQRAIERGMRYCHQYYDAHGNLKMPKGYTIDGFCLSTFLCRMRKKEAQGQLSEAQVDELRSMGEEFKKVTILSWEQKIQRLEQYKSEHGNLDISRDYITEDGIPFGRIFGYMRYRARTGRMSDQKLSQLRNMGVSIKTEM